MRLHRRVSAASAAAAGTSSAEGTTEPGSNEVNTTRRVPPTTDIRGRAVDPSWDGELRAFPLSDSVPLVATECAAYERAAGVVWTY